MNTESKADVGEVVVEKATPKAKPLPKKIKMTMMWGFIDAEGADHLWPNQSIVDDPEQIKMIVATTTHYKVLEA